MALEVRINSAKGGADRRMMLPHRLALHFWRLRGLVWRLAARDTIARNRGSYLGLLWTAITPLFLLAVYTFVFGFVFKVRWGTELRTSRGEFAMMLFCGILPFSILFGDAVSRAPLTVVGQPNFVTRVVFPAEALPASAVGSACLQFLGGFVVMLIGALAVRHTLSPEILLVPVLLIPLLLITTGLTFFLASVGVFVRDMVSSVQIALTLLFFMSPVFYQLQNLKPDGHGHGSRIAYNLMLLNPFTSIIEGFRSVVMRAEMPDWRWLGYSAVVGLVLCYLGVTWFLRTKKAFADVL